MKNKTNKTQIHQILFERMGKPKDEREIQSVSLETALIVQSEIKDYYEARPQICISYRYKCLLNSKEEIRHADVGYIDVKESCVNTDGDGACIGLGDIQEYFLIWPSKVQISRREQFKEFLKGVKFSFAEVI